MNTYLEFSLFFSLVFVKYFIVLVPIYFTSSIKRKQFCCNYSPLNSLVGYTAEIKVKEKAEIVGNQEAPRLFDTHESNTEL